MGENVIVELIDIVKGLDDYELEKCIREPSLITRRVIIENSDMYVKIIRAMLFNERTGRNNNGKCELLNSDCLPSAEDNSYKCTICVVALSPYNYVKPFNLNIGDKK